MPGTDLQQPKIYFPALTGVRALAAYMVFLHHFIPFHGPLLNTRWEYIFGELHVGVTFFFVLSGFLIHHRYSNIQSVERGWFRKYMTNRVARIIPLFFLLTCGTFVFNYFFHPADHGLVGKNLALWVLNISLIKGFFSGLKFSGIPQSWSLTVEFCFYATAPFLFARLKNILLYPRVSAILLLLGFGLVAVCSSLPLKGFFGDNRFMLSYSFLGRSFEFFAGCYLSDKLNDWKKERRPNGYFTYVSLGFIILLIFCLSLVRKPQIYGVHTFPGLIINNFFLPLMIILFFRGLLFERTLLSRIFSSKVGDLLGKASYAFYLVHVGFIEKGLHHYVTHNVLVLFVLLNLVSIALYLWVEEPLNLRVKKWLAPAPLHS